MWVWFAFSSRNLKKGDRVIAVDRVGYRLETAKGYGAEVVNFERYDETGAYIKEITSGGADCVIVSNSI